MKFTLTEEQELIRDAAADFLRGKFTGCAARHVSADPPGGRRLMWKELVELGWTGLAVPESYGGTGTGFLETCLLIEELGAYQLTCPFVPTVVCAGVSIERFGNEEQRQRWLPSIAAGQVMSYVRAAPNGGWGTRGSDLSATERRGEFLLSGTAWFVPYADLAEELLVVAQTGGPEELTVLVVDAGSAGIERTALDVVGNEPQYRLRFDDVAVPAWRVLGEPGAGARVVEVISAFGAVATCAEMVGGARRVLEMSVAYAGLREQFGKPIGAFQAVQQLCADMAVDVLGSRLITYEAVVDLAGGLADVLTVSSAKAWVSEAYQRVCASGHQVHGAIGYTREHDLHFYLRHALAGSLAFGDADFHTGRVCRELGIPNLG